MLTLPQHIIDLFWSYVDKTPNLYGCWLWTYSKDHAGYGLFNIPDKTRKKHHALIKAHRLAFILQYGPIPENKHVLHLIHCPNKHCVRHLYIGTAVENNHDKVLAGTSGKGMPKPGASQPGTLNGRAKLTEEDIQAIRNSTSVKSYDLLACQYHVSSVTIGHIIRRKTWKHIP